MAIASVGSIKYSKILSHKNGLLNVDYNEKYGKQ